MTGTIINTAAIIMAGLLGLALRRGIPEQMARTMQDGLGILILVIGLQYGFKADSLAIVGLSLALGAVIGEWRQWEAKLERLGEKLQSLTGGQNEQFVRGFVTATMVFCVGAMAILGSLEDGLTHNPQILIVKSMLDGIFSIIFAASMGVGVLFSAIPVFLYQGAITLGASFLEPLMTDPLLNNVTALGGILIAGIGLNTLGITRIRLANLLPGLFIVPLLMYIASLFKL
ncbi:MAG TPA: DUF554 domain-containing protein [Syntrophomonas sp.]|nr:DUF554 domain-containing protein [Syntrophomonas sp.]HRW13107.1 DUF554 domain-containing protein [Syntrophomonas sp.]